MNRSALLPAVFALALAAPLAGAEEAKTPALVAFAEGRALEQAGDFAAAISHFEESERLTPSVGTELNLGNCYEHEGRFASALRMYRLGAERAEKAGEAKRAAGAQKRAETVAARTSSVQILLQGDPPAELALTFDDQPAELAAYRQPQPVDGGKHRVTLVAPGYRAWSAEVVVESERARATVLVPALASAVDDEAPPPKVEPAHAATPPLEAPLPAPLPLAPPPPFWSAPRIAGAAFAGVAIAGLAVGTDSGARAISQWKARQDNCVASRCSPTGYALDGQAKTSATVATVAFTVAGAALVSSAALFWLAPRLTRSGSTRVGIAPLPGGAAAGIEGSF